METPLAFRTTKLRDAEPDVPPRMRSAGAAEVRRLADKGPGGDGIRRRLEGVAAMRASRAERHDATVRAWRVERRHITDEVLRDAVQLCVSTFRDRLRVGDLRIRSRDRRLRRRDQPRTLTRAGRGGPSPRVGRRRRRGFHALGRGLNSLRRRSPTCETLSARLTYAAAVPFFSRTIFSHTIDALVAVAHHTRGDVERFAAAETTELNKASVEALVAIAFLSSDAFGRLRVRRNSKRQARREDGVGRGTRRWREGRRTRAIERFLETIRDDRFADPPERRAALAELAEDHVEGDGASICRNARDADAARRSGRRRGPSCASHRGTNAKRRWCERLEARLEAWDGAAKRAFEKMASCAADLDERVNREYETTRDAVAAPGQRGRFARGTGVSTTASEGGDDDANDDAMHAH